MKNIQGPAIFLARFAGAQALLNSPAPVTQWPDFRISWREPGLQGAGA